MQLLHHAAAREITFLPSGHRCDYRKKTIQGNVQIRPLTQPTYGWCGGSINIRHRRGHGTTTRWRRAHRIHNITDGSVSRSGQSKHQISPSDNKEGRHAVQLFQSAMLTPLYDRLHLCSFWTVGPADWSLLAWSSATACLVLCSGWSTIMYALF